MGRERTWLAAALVVGLTGPFLPTNVVSSVLAAPVLLLLPGWAWMRALESRTTWACDAAERLGYGVALSFAGVALGAVAMSTLSIPLSSMSWAFLVTGLTVPALLATSGSPEGPGRTAAEFRATKPRLPAVAGTAVAGLLVLATVVPAVVVTLRSDAANRDPLTELGVRRMLDAHAKRVFMADVHNLEGRSVEYSLRFRTARGDVARFDRRLAAGAHWVRRISAEDLRYRRATMRVLLLRGDRTGVYRSARIAPDASLPAACDRVAGTTAFMACEYRDHARHPLRKSSAPAGQPARGAR
jgi:hypothetical protein